MMHALNAAGAISLMPPKMNSEQREIARHKREEEERERRKERERELSFQVNLWKGKIGNGVNIDGRTAEVMIKEAIQNMIDNGLVSEDRDRILAGLEYLHRITNKGFQTSIDNSVQVEIEEDPQRAATTMLDGGAFYIAKCDIPKTPDMQSTDFDLRIKKSTDRTKFERSRKLQEALGILSRDGRLNGIRVAQTAYADPLNMVTIEPFIQHKRLTDILREKCDEEKADIVESSILDVVEISRVLTRYRDVRDENGNYVLKKNYKTLDIFRNFLDGNYVIEETDNTSHFIHSFALGNVPFLAETIRDKKGRISRSKLRKNKVLRDLEQAFDQDFESLYRRRNRHMVNKDSHTGNVLVEIDNENPDAKENRVYCDFEHTYWDIIEDPVAEMILTSGINDRRVIRELVDKVYERYEGEINVSKEGFWDTFQRRLIEKTLKKSTRCLKTSTTASCKKDRDNLVHEASAYYSSAVKMMDDLGLEDSAKAVRAFNEEYLKLKEVTEAPNWESTLASLVSNVSPREVKWRDYRKPLESKEVLSFAKKAAITSAAAGVSLGLIGLISGNRLPEQERVDHMKLIYMSHANEAVSSIPEMNVRASPFDDAQEVLRTIFATDDDEGVKKVINQYKPSTVPRKKSGSLSNLDFWLSRRGEAVDHDLVKAIYIVGKKKNHVINHKKERDNIYGNMLWSVSNPFFRDMTDRTAPTDSVDVGVAVRYLATLTRYHEGNFTHTVSDYVCGRSMYEAMAEAGSKDYWDYRKHLDAYDRRVCDDIIVNYLALKGALGNIPIEPEPEKWYKRFSRQRKDAKFKERPRVR